MTHRHQTISTLNYFRLSGGGDVDRTLQSSLTLPLTARPLPGPLQLSPRHFPLTNITVDNAAIILMLLPLKFSLRVMFLPEVSSLSLFLWLGVQIFCSQIHTELLPSASSQNFHINHLEISSKGKVADEKHDHLPRRWLPPYWLYSLPLAHSRHFGGALRYSTQRSLRSSDLRLISQDFVVCVFAFFTIMRRKLGQPLLCALIVF